jgi:predicted O-methyltransferase YrrM
VKILAKIVEVIKALIYMPIYISNINKRGEDLLRIEHKLDVISQKLADIELGQLTKNLTLSDQLKGADRNMILKNDEPYKSEIPNLISTVEQNFENHFLQFESLLSIYNSLPNLKVMPATRGWAGSPDFLAKIIEIIFKEKPCFVLEAGSGVSTLIIGLSLKLNNCGKLISLDHERPYAKITTENLYLNDTGDVANVMHCPLKEYDILEQTWKWYGIDNLKLTDEIDLLIIDGPPGSIQTLSRYPVVPLLHKYFSDRVLILLDDANRNDEITTVQKWIEFLEIENFKVAITPFNGFEKGLVILEVCRLK